MPDKKGVIGKSVNDHANFSIKYCSKIKATEIKPRRQFHPFYRRNYETYVNLLNNLANTDLWNDTKHMTY